MARTPSNMASRAGTSADPAMAVAVAIFAHQEERRIAGCLGSLPLDRPDTIFHVLVNGTTDRTVARARAAAAGRPHVIVHDIAAGGKSRTWNHFVHHLLTGTEDAVIFLDGDAQIAPGSIDALVADLAAHPQANAAAGMPVNGREVETYRRNLRIERGIFGDLYALPAASSPPSGRVACACPTIWSAMTGWSLPGRIPIWQAMPTGNWSGCWPVKARALPANRSASPGR